MDASGAVERLVLVGGEVVEADEYVMAAPVDIFKRLVPEAWSTMPFFRQLDQLEGVPVINLQIWFDRKLGSSLDGLAFSSQNRARCPVVKFHSLSLPLPRARRRSPLLSVYADMSKSCDEYADDERSMLELVFAPCTPQTGAEFNWLSKSDEEIVDATLGELARLFPLEIAPDARWPSTLEPRCMDGRTVSVTEQRGAQADPRHWHWSSFFRQFSRNDRARALPLSLSLSLLAATLFLGRLVIFSAPVPTRGPRAALAEYSEYELVSQSASQARGRARKRRVPRRACFVL